MSKLYVVFERKLSKIGSTGLSGLSDVFVFFKFSKNDEFSFKHYVKTNANILNLKLKNKD